MLYILFYYIGLCPVDPFRSLLTFKTFTVTILVYPFPSTTRSRFLSPHVPIPPPGRERGREKSPDQQKDLEKTRPSLKSGVTCTGFAVERVGSNHGSKGYRPWTLGQVVEKSTCLLYSRWSEVFPESSENFNRFYSYLSLFLNINCQ